MASSESKLWYLEQINVFRDLGPEDLERVDKISTMKTLDKGKFIYFPEEPSKVIFLLKQGRVKIGSYSEEGKEIIKAILEPGEIFGELAVAGQEKRVDFVLRMVATLTKKSSDGMSEEEKKDFINKVAEQLND